jgi:hypothetical protein
MLATRRPQSFVATWLAGVAALATLAGCGNDLGQVSGLVTLDGKPLRGGNGVSATVMFQPLGGGVPGVGVVDGEGRYAITSGSQSGVKPGGYAVTCAATQLIPGKDGGAASGKGLTDPKYASAATSALQFTVQPGANEFNIDLQSPK